MNKKKYATILILAGTLFLGGCSFFIKKGNVVKIIRNDLGFQLMVNSQPVYIYGAGVGEAFGKNGENYLALAKELGANTVRTWGTDQGTRRYLDEAHRKGLWVNAGIWINHTDDKKTISYIHGDRYMREKEKETLEYVRRFKNHPAVLFWNIGNECIFFTKDPQERKALCIFIEKLIQKVKKIDPNHPVIYASVNSLDLPYLKKYIPSLDVIGMNIYGSVIGSQSGWEALDFGKPYVVTEFGPLGPWDLPKDSHGKMIEQDDRTKAQQYRNHWTLIKERKGKNIGGFVFHVGETSQESMTMWNLNDGLFKKEPFLMMQKLYGVSNGSSHAPKIESFSGVLETAYPGQEFEVSLLASHPDKESILSYEYRASTSTQDILQYYVNVYAPIKVKGEGSKVIIEAPNQPGIYRIYGFVKDQKGRSASLSRTLKVSENE